MLRRDSMCKGSVASYRDFSSQQGEYGRVAREAAPGRASMGCSVYPKYTVLRIQTQDGNSLRTCRSTVSGHRTSEPTPEGRAENRVLRAGCGHSKGLLFANRH